MITIPSQGILMLGPTRQGRPNKFLRNSTALTGLLLYFSLVLTQAYAAEGGYSNYVPGFYDDIALAVEPVDGLLLRNDVYFYSAEAAGIGPALMWIPPKYEGKRAFVARWLN